jgi:hypothetical protein
LGSHLVIAAPIRFSHLGGEWVERIAGRRAVRYDISVDPDRGRWYLDASWKTTPQPAPVLGELRAGRVVGVDLNADHLAACALDASGNPIGAPVSIAVDTAGLPASKREGRVRAPITLLLDTATHHRCAAVVVENLDFADARATGRETLGRGREAVSPLWALHQAGEIANPPTLAGTAVLAHRRAHRSTREHPPAAAITVRTATEQNTLLLSHEERSTGYVNPFIWPESTRTGALPHLVKRTLCGLRTVTGSCDTFAVPMSR